MTSNGPSLNDLLNVSTPYAPASQEEIQARLSAVPRHEGVAPPAVESPAVPVEEEPSRSSEDRGPGGTVPREIPIAAPATSAASTADDALDLQKIGSALEAARNRTAELEEALAERRVRHGSADGRVHVVADAYGDILELHVDPQALRGHGARTLGRSLVDTIQAARDAGVELRGQFIEDFRLEGEEFDAS